MPTPGIQVPHTVQAKLAVSQPGDPYEREADEVADEVVEGTGDGDVEGMADEEETVQPKAISGGNPSMLQRQCPLDNSCGETPGPSGENDIVQRKVKPGIIMGHSGKDDQKEAGEVFENSLDKAKGGGEPLPARAKSQMETSFGADFSSVMIHRDDHAHDLSGSINALAFTSGTHIFFNKGTGDVTTSLGKRLLAHELTHVLQQTNGLKSGNKAEWTPRSLNRKARKHNAPIHRRTFIPPIMRQSGDKNMVRLGGLMFFDSTRQPIELKDTIFVIEGIKALPYGVYEVQIIGDPGSYKLVIGNETHQITRAPAELPKVLKKAVKIYIINSPPVPRKPDVINFEEEETITAELPKDTKKQEELEKQKGKEEKKEEKKGPEEKGKGETGKEKGKGSEEIPEEVREFNKEGAPGSEFGLFGLLKGYLPKELIEVLDEIVKLTMDEYEVKSFRNLLATLVSLSKHSDTIKPMFENPDKLLSIALGIDEDTKGAQLLNEVRSWVYSQPANRSMRLINKKNSGIVKIGKKIIAIINKMKAILTPIFKIRDRISDIVMGMAAIVAGVEGLEELIENKWDTKEKFNEALEMFTTSLSKEVHDRLEGARNLFDMLKEKFLEEDLLKREEIALALTDALFMASGKKVKPAVKFAKATGLDSVIAEYIVQNMIPDAVMEKINSLFRDVFNKLDEKFLSSIKGDFDRVMLSLEHEIQQNVISQLKNFNFGELQVQRSAVSGSPADYGEMAPRALSFAARSGGEQLRDDTLMAMEQGLGFDFSSVRIHRDAPAQAASQMLNANAFALGGDVYFGAGQYSPGSRGGRRLIAHELTHVMQQGQGSGPEVIRREYNATLKKLATMFSSKIIDTIRNSKKQQSDQDKKLAEKIIKKINSQLKDKEVKSATSPDIEGITSKAYFYVLDKNKKPKRIRRRAKWLFLLPALTISKNRIKYGFLSIYDPKKKDREQLRRNLNCNTKKNEEAHHIIPLERRRHPIVKLAEKNKFGFNTKDNGICLGPKTHYGSHPVYTEYVTQLLNGVLAANPELSPAKLNLFHDSVRKLHVKLNGMNKSGKSIEDIK